MESLMTVANWSEGSFCASLSGGAAMADKIVPDFPLTNKGFNLSHGNDLWTVVPGGGT